MALLIEFIGHCEMFPCNIEFALHLHHEGLVMMLLAAYCQVPLSFTLSKYS